MHTITVFDRDILRMIHSATTDWYLDVPTTEFNKACRDRRLTAETVAHYRRCRRRAKNAGYSRDSRRRRALSQTHI